MIHMLNKTESNQSYAFLVTVDKTEFTKVVQKSFWNEIRTLSSVLPATNNDFKFKADGSQE